MGFDPEFINFIDECVKDSFEVPNDYYESDNDILNADENSIKYRGVYLVPVFFIND